MLQKYSIEYVILDSVPIGNKTLHSLIKIIGYGLRTITFSNTNITNDAFKMVKILKDTLLTGFVFTYHAKSNNVTLFKELRYIRPFIYNFDYELKSLILAIEPLTIYDQQHFVFIGLCAKFLLNLNITWSLQITDINEPTSEWHRKMLIPQKTAKIFRYVRRKD